MQQESIYNLIPKEYIPPPKEKMYKSQYPGRLPPSASTFNNHTTSRPKINNLHGNFDVADKPHTHKGRSSSLGKVKGSYKPNTTEFRLKQTGTMGSNELPQVRPFKYDQSTKRPPVPSRADPPIHGLKSNKNFVVTNAVENILSAPKTMPEQKSWTNKKDYGRTPEYIEQIKDNIESEYQMIQNLHVSEAEELDKQNVRYLMTPDEVDKLKEGLKKKWAAVNKEYQSITHIKQIDTIGLKRKKETCEKELKQLEADIAKLNKQYIFVDTNK